MMAASPSLRVLTKRSGSGGSGDPELFADETPDVFAERNRAFTTPVVISVPAGEVVAEPTVLTPTKRSSFRCCKCTRRRPLG